MPPAFHVSPVFIPCHGAAGDCLGCAGLYRALERSLFIRVCGFSGITGEYTDIHGVPPLAGCAPCRMRGNVWIYWESPVGDRGQGVHCIVIQIDEYRGISGW